MLIVRYPNMHVTGIDHVDRRMGDNFVMHASIRRDHRQKVEAEGLVPGPKHRVGKGMSC